MVGYKGFDKDLKCRDKQYAIGETFEESTASLCKEGMHFCENPHDCCGYYNTAESRYCKVYADDVSDESDGDSKRVCKKLKIGAEISVFDIVRTSVSVFFQNFHFAEKISESGTNTAGNYGAANAGDYGAANAGNYGAANAGNYGAANAGDYGAANAGYRGAAIVQEEGKASVGTGGVAVALGKDAMASGKIGAVLVLVERDDACNVIHHRSILVDGVKYAADTYYMLKNNRVKKVGVKI